MQVDRNSQACLSAPVSEPEDICLEALKRNPKVKTMTTE